MKFIVNPYDSVSKYCDQNMQWRCVAISQKILTSGSLKVEYKLSVHETTSNDCAYGIFIKVSAPEVLKLPMVKTKKY